MADKRIIEQTATSEVFVDDWLVKDSSTEGTTKIRPSNLKDYIAAGLVPETMVADEYVTTSTYYSGDICIYEGVLYKALEDDITGDWDSTKWDAITISSELENSGTETASDVSYDNTSSTGVQATNVQDALDEAFQRTMDMSTWFTDIVAENFDYTKTYTVGDYVFHFPSIGVIKLYKCIENTSGAWNSSKWEEVKLSNEVSDEVTLREELESATKVYGTPKNLPQPIATFTDGSALPMPSLKTTIVPVQDLHGYDAPWVGGSGRNLFNMGSKWSGSASGLTFTTDDDYVTINNTKKGGNYVTPSQLYFDLPAGTYYAKALVISGTASNAPSVYVYSNQELTSNMLNTERSFTLESQTSVGIRFAFWNDGATYSNYKLGIVISKTANIDKFYPYSNICPISGWDEVDVARAGKNLCKSTVHGYVSSSDDLIVIDNDTESAIFYAHEGQTYTISSSATMNKSRVALVGTDNVVNYTPILQREILSDNVNTWTATWTGWTVWYKCSSRQTAFDNSTQVELGSTATTYEPYNGHTYTIPFTDSQGNPIEVFGGECDVVNGGSGNIKTFESVDLGTLSWTYSQASGNRSLFTTYDLQGLYKSTGSNNIPINAICESYENVSMETTFVSGQCGFDGLHSARLVICDNSYTDATEFKSAVSGIKLVYELATPTTFISQPTSIKSLEGSNNVWGDCGQIKDLKYVRNLNITINDLISRVEALEG